MFDQSKVSTFLHSLFKRWAGNLKASRCTDAVLPCLSSNSWVGNPLTCLMEEDPLEVIKREVFSVESSFGSLTQGYDLTFGWCVGDEQISPGMTIFPIANHPQPDPGLNTGLFWGGVKALEALFACDFCVRFLFVYAHTSLVSINLVAPILCPPKNQATLIAQWWQAEDWSWGGGQPKAAISAGVFQKKLLLLSFQVKHRAKRIPKLKPRWIIYENEAPILDEVIFADFWWFFWRLSIFLSI